MLVAGRDCRVETPHAVGAAVDPTVRRSVHYRVDERPAVDVRHTDGTWYAGRLHAWLLCRSTGRRGEPAGARWRAVVSYHVAAGLQYYLDVPAGRVRPRPAYDDPTRHPASS